MSTVDKDAVNLDRILTEEVGQWGWYQVRAMVLCALAVNMVGLNNYSYLFTIAKIRTRCVIPECENSSNPAAFSPPWIFNAVPATGNSFDNCHRFPAVTSIPPNTSDACPAIFNRNSSIECEEYVYEHENSGYFEFNLACDDWRPTLVGSARTLGMFFCLPMTGFVSDRWGRRITLALNAFNSAWIGCLTYFATSYNSYILLCFADCVFGACVLPSAYILAMEFVGPKHRVVAGVTMNTIFSLGQVLLGLIAWAEPHWRHLILIISVPHLVFFAYFWIAPESIRWLLSKGRYKESLVILKEAARMNKNVLSQRTVEGFLEAKEVKTEEQDNSDDWLVGLVFKNKIILLRCLVTPVWWLTTILVSRGLTISSVEISGNKYFNYAASASAEIPGYWIAFLLLDRIGRKAMVFTGLWVSGACQIAYIFISNEHYWLSLLIFVLGKMWISSVFASLYIYTAELYPTQYRTSLVAYSSMIGRVGGILAPLMPGLAAEVWEQLPFALFGGMALLSGLLVLLTPETLGKALPDTMDEAANLRNDSPSKIMRCLRTLVFRSKTINITKNTTL